MTRVILEDVTKRFGDVVAVDDVSLEVKEGELFTLLGPSGCGKTTTLRIIAGFELPDEGKVLFDSEEVTFKKPYERGCAMVFQNYALWPHMNVFDNVAYGLKMRKLPMSEIKKRVEEVLDLVGLRGLEDRFPLQLSGGQQQRVALARALVVEPKVLLLDEPLSNLDAKLRLRMREEVKKLQRRLGITTIYVTHDQEEAMSLSDRVAIMNRGRILQIGSPMEVYMSPRNLFVATFIGRSTILRGRVIESSDISVVLDAGGLRIEGYVAENIRLEKGREAIAVMRPEDFSLEAEAESNKLEGHVELAMFLGPFKQIRVRVGSQTIIAYVDPELEIDSGSKVTLYIGRDDVAIFPIEEWEEIGFEAIA